MRVRVKTTVSAPYQSTIYINLYMHVHVIMPFMVIEMHTHYIATRAIFVQDNNSRVKMGNPMTDSLC